MWKRDIARRLLANSTQPDALRRDEINNGLIYLAQHKSHRRCGIIRAMIFDIEFLLATQQIASITGLPMTHARDRLVRATENHLGGDDKALVSCIPEHVSGYDMAQMFHALVRQSVGLANGLHINRHLVP
jgi:hypothetical protein